MKPAFALHFETRRDARRRWRLARVRAVRVLDTVTLGEAGAFAEVETGERDNAGQMVRQIVPRGELLSLHSLQHLSGATAEKSASISKAGDVAPGHLSA